MIRLTNEERRALANKVQREAKQQLEAKLEEAKKYKDVVEHARRDWNALSGLSKILKEDQSLHKVTLDYITTLHAQDMLTGISVKHTNLLTDEIVLLERECSSIQEIEGRLKPIVSE